MRLLVLFVGIVLVLASCADPKEAGPVIEALEGRNPVVSDLEVSSAERVGFVRHDGGSEGLVDLANDSGRYGYRHEQQFAPVDGFSLDDVESDLLGLVEAAGWEMWGNGDVRSYCGQMDLDLADRAYDDLTVRQTIRTIDGVRTDVVVVQLTGGPHGTVGCHLDIHTEPWEG